MVENKVLWLLELEWMMCKMKVACVDLKMTCESCFLVELFQLTFLCFHLVKYMGVPRGRVRE